MAILTRSVYAVPKVTAAELMILAVVGRLQVSRRSVSQL